MAKQLTPQPIYLTPTPPPPSSSVLAIPGPGGRAPGAINIGGIGIGGQGYSAGAVIQGPGLIVQTGLIVRVRGNPANTGTAIVARTREDAAAGNGDPVQPNTEIVYPLDNLAGMYVRIGNTGDAVTVSVRSE